MESVDIAMTVHSNGVSEKLRELDTLSCLAITSWGASKSLAAWQRHRFPKVQKEEEEERGVQGGSKAGKAVQGGKGKGGESREKNQNWTEEQEQKNEERQMK